MGVGRLVSTSTGCLRVTGGRRLTGSLTPQGSKGTATLLYAAALSCVGDVRLDNVPAISDTAAFAALARKLGYLVDHSQDCLRLRVDPSGAVESTVDKALGRSIRVTASIAAAILARTGRVEFPFPGGDGFCARPIDRHLEAMRAAGAIVEVVGGVVRASLPHGLRPFKISAGTSHGPSVGATVTALLLAAGTTGASLVTDASPEPEIDQVVAFLRACGVKIEPRFDGAYEVAGTGTVGGARFRVPVDRIEAGTLAVAAVATGGSVTLLDCVRDDLSGPVLELLASAGARVEVGPAGTTVTAGSGGVGLDLRTGPAVDFPTDLQPVATSLLTQLTGTSTVTERVYRSRDSHVVGLRKFGADISTDGPIVTVRGPRSLTAADVVGTDIRCGTAYVVAALIANGTSTIGGLPHIDRGHGDLVGQLCALGADVVRGQ
jgi:UDP-N-acetylglucosamine 1-carboxyvinyltransferase